MEQSLTLDQETHYCQSCGMPMENAEVLGSETDGQKSQEYCMYCYEAGEFKQPEITQEEMMDHCTGFLIKDGMAEEEARSLLAGSLPHLKRWSGQQ
ncbi:zinc ribbon domain-containing protein [Paenibacillus albidus]|uniref:zinc ribbon domain-containing protein n=1 Tax=Paenibacillus albidus TaxID=2041023 RepID=UPI001BE618A6|nr:zinc ribbon domain-containing protein [Paenibacillus albidus]MBT2293410.1 zinc ribbon domain-containing protein [Paenibacillus albidus]